MRANAHTGQRYAGCILALGCLLLGACDNAIAPFVEGNEDFFVLTGYLHANRDTQFVRVEPVRRSPEAEPGAKLDVTVVSTQLATGAVVAWRDSLVQLENGTTGHLFYARFTPQPGATYRLDVRLPDGRATSAVTRVPPAPPAVVGPPTADSLGILSQIVLWQGATDATDLTVFYHVTDATTGIMRTVALPYDGADRPAAEGLAVTVQLQRDFRRILNQIHVPGSDTLIVLHGLGMEIEQRSAEWLDPEGARNITNGYGFFAAAGRFATTWTLDTTTTRLLGYLVP